MNKKAALTIGTVVALTLALLVILIGYRIYSNSGDKLDSISNTADKLIDNLIGQTEDPTIPCRCSSGNQRVTINEQVYCKSSFDQQRCTQAGFLFDDGTCYYTTEQCNSFLT